MAFITAPARSKGFTFNPIAAIWNGLMALAENNPRLKAAEALHRLSDEELAKRGLRRQDIATYVFADCYWV
jgi:isocitrate/isopropylmalate dehydrogenase